MSNELTIIEQKQVSFYADQITAVLVETPDGERVVYVPVRPICQLLGVDWSAQRKRINNDEVLKNVCVAVTATQIGDDQRRSMLALPLDYLNGWLFGINAKRVKATVRDQLLRYQKDCYRVLSEAFQSGQLSFDDRYADLLNSDSPVANAYRMAQAIMDMARRQVIHEARLDDYGQRIESLEAWRGDSGRLVTPAQQSQISQAVKVVALELGKNTGRNEFGGVYGELYRRYEISGYQQLPATKFEDAIQFLRDWFESLTDDSVPF